MLNRQLFDYIKQQLAQGVSKEIINTNLLSQGWQQVDVNEAFSVAESQNTAIPQPPQMSSASGKSNLKINLMTAGFSLIMLLCGFVAWVGLGIMPILVIIVPFGMFLSYAFTSETFIKERPYIILLWPFLFVVLMLKESFFGMNFPILAIAFMSCLFPSAIAFYRKKRKNLNGQMNDMPNNTNKGRWAIIGLVLILFGLLVVPFFTNGFGFLLTLDYHPTIRSIDFHQIIIDMGTDISIAEIMWEIAIFICSIIGTIFSIKGLKSSKQEIAITGTSLGLLTIVRFFISFGYILF